MTPNVMQSKILPFFFLTLLFALPASAQLLELGKLAEGLVEILEKAAQNQVVTARIFIFLIVVIALYEVFEHLKIRKGTSALLGLLFGALVTAFTPTSLALLIGNLWTWLFAIVLLGVPFWLIWTAYTHFPKLLIPLTIIVIIFTGILYQGLPEAAAEAKRTAPAPVAKAIDTGVNWIQFFIGILWVLSLIFLILSIYMWIQQRKRTAPATPPSPATIQNTTTAAAAVTTSGQAATTAGEQTGTELGHAEQELEETGTLVEEGQRIETQAQQEATTGVVSQQTHTALAQYKTKGEQLIAKLKKRIETLEKSARTAEEKYNTLFTQVKKWIKDARNQKEEIATYIKEAIKRSEKYPAPLQQQVQQTLAAFVTAARDFATKTTAATNWVEQRQYEQRKNKLMLTTSDAIEKLKIMTLLVTGMVDVVKQYEKTPVTTEGIAKLTETRKKLWQDLYPLLKITHLLRKDLAEFDKDLNQLAQICARFEQENKTIESALLNVSAAIEEIFKKAIQSEAVTQLQQKLTPLASAIDAFMTMLSKNVGASDFIKGSHAEQYHVLLTALSAVDAAEKSIQTLKATPEQQKIMPVLEVIHAFKELTTALKAQFDTTKGELDLRKTSAIDLFMTDFRNKINKHSKDFNNFKNLLAQLQTS